MRFDLTSAVCIPGLLRGGNGLAAQASREEAVIIASQDTYIAVSKSGIAIRGDLTVNGNIISTGAVKAGKIDLQSHVHPSANPGENTGKPQ